MPERPASPDARPTSMPAAFRPVPRTGVIYVTEEAAKRGFTTEAEDWCNLGQGQPETGALPGAPERLGQVSIDVGDQEYAPVAGLPELREAIAELYNQLYRRGMKSRYTAENVCIAGGGRTSLTRVAASLGQVNLGHFLPDYTAYEELLDVFKAFTPIPILLDRDRGYTFTAEELHREITGRGLSALLFSNPSNPTGKRVGGGALAEWVGHARALDCTLLVDEFYSRYIWDAPEGELPVESAARYVEDVEKDPVVIFDGLTKNWRYPGWRMTWAVGPRRVIDGMASAGSFLDGGGNRPLQRAAIPLMSVEHVIAETAAIHRAFGRKRELLMEGLQALGVRLDASPEGTFYIWGDVSGLPPSINTGRSFFRAALEHQVIAVPGEFFDINPGKRRKGHGGRFSQHLRFSFGPSLPVLQTALDRLGTMIRRAADAG
ncbi:MAG TPA: pyridoxal phosphate-dependent aminotransferase [Myxococcaceae bacterium]|nr:pyridoxal phosphate-dependent aminotransferase [Myxococcaceae bacterium]